jgi:hypothetical protein
MAGMIMRKVLVACFFILAFALSSHAEPVRYWIEIGLTDEAGVPLAGASVQVYSPRENFIAQRATEDPTRAGTYHAGIDVDFTGGWTQYYELPYIIRATKGGYEELYRNLMFKRNEDLRKKFSFHMKRELAKGQEVHVQVRRSDNNNPIGDAAVMVCNQMGLTDTNGKVKLRFVEAVPDGRCNITIQQSFFDSLDGYNVRIKMYDDDAKDVYVTCRMKPRDNPSAGEGSCGPGSPSDHQMAQAPDMLKIRVTVKDKSDTALAIDKRPEVSGASVTLTTGSGSVVTGADKGNGVYEFTLDPIKDAGKNAMLKFAKQGFRTVTTVISGTQLTPGPQPVAVYMETDKKDELKEWADEIEAEFTKKRMVLSGACQKVDQAGKSVSEYHESLVWIAVGYKQFERLLSAASAECGHNKTLRGQAQGFIQAALSAESNLRVALDTANQKAAACRTKEDADVLETLWGSIRTLSWDVHLNAAKAEGLNNRIRNTIARAQALASRLDKADAQTPVPLAEFPKKAQEMVAGLKRLQSASFGGAYNEAATARKQLNDYGRSAVRSIASYPRNPALDRLKTIINSVLPDNRHPCDEEGMKDSLDKLIADWEKPAQSFSATIQQLRGKYPLCAGERAEDALIAQGQNAQNILIYVTSSDIQGRIQACRTGAVTTPKPEPAASAPKAKDDDGDGVPNDRDKCPGTPFGHPVDANGCSLLQKFSSGNMWIDAPDQVKPGQQLLSRANADPELAGMMRGLSGALIYRWYINDREMGKGTENYSYTVPGAYTYDRIIVSTKLFWFNAQNAKETFLKEARKRIAVKTPEPRETRVNGAPGANRISGEGKSPTKSFGRTDKEDLWVPFNFSFGAPAKLLGAKVRMKVWPLGGLTNTDELYLKGASGKTHSIYRDFNKLKQKEWNIVDVDVSGNQDIMAAIRAGRVEGCIQDDTDVDSVQLILMVEE